MPFVFSMGAGGSVAYALQPNPAFCASAAFAVRRGPLSLAVEAEWRPPSQLSYRRLSALGERYDGVRRRGRAPWMAPVHFRPLVRAHLRDGTRSRGTNDALGRSGIRLDHAPVRRAIGDLGIFRFRVTDRRRQNR
jgi:hypothetical protein